MMALSLIGEIISQNVVDIRALPCLADWASFAMGGCTGIIFCASIILLWEASNAR